MPACKRCNRSGSSADFRKSSAGGYLCKDKPACDNRVRVHLNDWAKLDELAHAVLVHAQALAEHIEGTHTLAAIRQFGVLNDEASELGLQLALAGTREGMKQATIADGLGVKPSALRGLKQMA